MATDAGELIVKISGDISDLKSSLQEMRSQVHGLSATTIAEGTLMADAFREIGKEAVKFVMDSVRAFGEHEQAMTRLNLLVGKDGAAAMESFAQAMQRTTTFSDDQVLSLERQLSQYGVYPGSVKEATKALLDFSTVTGVDLPAAGQMLAKAMAGQSRELKNYGIDVSTSATRSQNLDTVLKGLNSRFHDAAETMKGTTLGAVSTLSNAFDDLKKNIGELVAPALTKVTSALANWLQGINDASKNSKGYSDTLDDQRAKLKYLTDELKELTAMGRTNTQGLQAAIKATADHVKALAQVAKGHDAAKGATERELASVRALKDEIGKLEQEQGALGEITQLTITKNILAAQNELVQLKANEEAITQMTELETEKRLISSQQSWETQASFSDQFRVKLADDMNHSKSAFADMAQSSLASFSNATAKMIVEGGRFADVLKNLWQQIAEQVIAQIIRMIAEWLIWMALTGGSGGFVSGFMAEGGMINEPSMIVGLKSGSRHIAGEAGPEQVVPSGGGGNFAFENSGMSGGAGSKGSSGGGDIHVHISGQFIEGNPSKWQRMIQDQIAPQIRRLAMKDPNSLITRKRGAMS